MLCQMTQTRKYRGWFAHILCIGNQMAGSEINQKRKKHIKSRVVVPDDSGRWLAGCLNVCCGWMFRAWYCKKGWKGSITHWAVCSRVQELKHSRMLLTLGQMARSITFTQSPPILACTPYQILPKSKEEEDWGSKTIRLTRHWICYIPSHCPSVKCTPQASINAETGSCNDRECDMVDGTRPGIQNDEWGNDAITYPHTNPCLPPRKLQLNHCRRDHPSAREYRRSSVNQVH